MAASDAITVEATARTLIERSTAYTAAPALTSADIDILLGMATSQDDASADQWTVSDLNRVVSLGWSWKAGIATASFKTGVGPGKTFELQQQYDHCVEMAGRYGNGTLSVVGLVEGDDGTGAGNRSGSLQLSTVLTDTTT